MTDNNFKPTGVIRNDYLPRLLFLLICIFLFGITVSTIYLYLDISRPLSTHYSAILSIVRELKETLIIRTMKINAFFYLLIVTGIVILGVLYTHRIAGPMHRIKLYAKSVFEGELGTEINFRRKDAIHSFANDINEMTKSYNQRVTMLTSDIQQLKEALTELKSLSEKDEDTEIALKTVHDLDSRIKKLLSAIKL